jgi:hypothetical protein
MSTKKVQRVQLKLDVPLDVRDKLKEAAEKTGFSMTQIFSMLVREYCSSLDVSNDMRRVLAKVASRNREQLALTPKQKKVIGNDILNEKFTKDLI